MSTCKARGSRRKKCKDLSEFAKDQVLFCGEFHVCSGQYLSKGFGLSKEQRLEGVSQIPEEVNAASHSSALSVKSIYHKGPIDEVC